MKKDFNKLTIVSPQDLDNINQEKINVTIALTDGSHDDDKKHGFRYFKLFLNNEVIAEYRHKGKNSIRTHQFKDIDLAGYANSDLPVVLQARVYKGKSSTSTDVISNQVNIIIDTKPPEVKSVFPNDTLEKQRLGEAVIVEVSDQHSGIDPSSCSATLVSEDNRTIPLEIEDGDLVPPNEIVSFQFGKRGQVGLLGLGKHKLNLSLKDVAGNLFEETYDFEIEHAIPIENDFFQVLRSFTDFNNLATDEPFLVPPGFTYGEDYLISFTGLTIGDFSWKSEIDNFKASVRKGSGKLQIKLPGDLVWSSDAESRNLFKNTFRKLLDSIELEENSKFSTSTTEQVRKYVVRSIPLPVSELLPWGCGLDRTLRSVSVLPGFRLRVSSASFQFSGPGRDTVNGMVPSGEMFFPVGRQRISDGSFITTLNPMSTGLAQSGYTQQDSLVDGMIGGPADLHEGDLMRKHLAIVLPATLPSSATASSVDLEHVALVAADDYQALSQGIQTATGDTTDSSGSFVIRRFRGRTDVVVEFPVFINGNKHFVPIGTTLRQVCEQYLHWFTSAMLDDGNISWKRQWLVKDSDREEIVLRNIHWTDIGLGAQNSYTDIADVPLLQGDHIDFKLDL